METNYMYLLECADGSLYCGWTNHLEERVKAHNEGRGAKYTKSRRPVALVYYEQFATRQDAMRREWEVKQLDRRKKQELIAGRISGGEGGTYGENRCGEGECGEGEHGEGKCTGDGEFRHGEEHVN